MKAVIFDYNRTIYNPETGTLISGAKEVLKQLEALKISMYLVSKGNNERMSQIKDLGIETWFKDLVVVEEKSLQDFENLQKMEPEDTLHSIDQTLDIINT